MRKPKEKIKCPECGGDLVLERDEHGDPIIYDIFPDSSGRLRAKARDRPRREKDEWK